MKAVKPYYKIITLVLTGFAVVWGTAFHSPEWGFFGHRKINRMAVFTLPPEMISFYKKNIEYITEHSVDPDKRRYATKHEGVRHYIDIDAWGDQPFKTVPRIFSDALIKYNQFFLINGMDTTTVEVVYDRDTTSISFNNTSFKYETQELRNRFRKYIMPQYYEDQWILNESMIDSLFPGVNDQQQLLVEDHFSSEGILPYHLNKTYFNLVQAFKNKDRARILRISAEFGHYIGDAHVPLHTTRNYNGQLTDQVGIHAFWESRIPELFADKEYSYLVGKAQYIDKPHSYFWNIVYESHQLLEDVLKIEQDLRKSFPEDQQMCYDERLDRTIKTQCPEFAKAYQERMQGMVERRMQDAILSIGSVWFSAWVDAGQPDLKDFGEIVIEEEKIEIDPNVNTRSHE